MKKDIFKIILSSIILIIVFVAAAVLINTFLLPILPKALQSWVSTVTGSLFVTITVFAGLSQITGLTLKNIFLRVQSKSRHNNDSLQGAIILDASYKGEIKLEGDILQNGSTKIVLEQSKIIDSKYRNETIERLISTIQDSLYEDNSRLPYVLSICLDLCAQVGMTEYDQWINNELNGYKDFLAFQKSFPSETDYINWMKRFGDHRFIKAYIKVSFFSVERQRRVLDTLPHRDIFVAYSLAQIIRDLQRYRERGIPELSVSLQSLGQISVDEVQETINQLSPGMQVPHDLEVFSSVTSLEGILDGVRNKICALILDARKKCQPK
jgi:membrane protein implicated in regulation of membrane protease activity